MQFIINNRKLRHLNSNLDEIVKKGSVSYDDYQKYIFDRKNKDLKKNRLISTLSEECVRGGFFCYNSVTKQG